MADVIVTKDFLSYLLFSCLLVLFLIAISHKKLRSLLLPETSVMKFNYLNCRVTECAELSKFVVGDFFLSNLTYCMGVLGHQTFLSTVNDTL